MNIERPHARRSNHGLRPHDLLYALDDEGGVLLAPRVLLLEALATRMLLPVCGCWREARERLPRRFYGRLVHEWVQQKDQPPLPEHPLPHAPAVMFGEWPCIGRTEMVEWLPAELFRRFGNPDETDFERCPVPAATVAHAGALLTWLADAGYDCEQDERLTEVFEEPRWEVGRAAG